MKPKIIEEIYAWISVAEDGDEGVISAIFGNKWMPFVGADAERVASLRHFAVEAVNGTGSKAYLKKFSTVEIIEEVSPQ